MGGVTETLADAAAHDYERLAALAYS